MEGLVKVKGLQPLEKTVQEKCLWGVYGASMKVKTDLENILRECVCVKSLLRRMGLLFLGVKGKDDNFS